MTRIKICGLTNRDDSMAAAEYGADLLGFIGVPESPRYVDSERQREAARDLPPFVQTVVIGRYEKDVDGYVADFRQYYLDDAQQSAVERDRSRAIRCFPIKDRTSLEAIRTFDRRVAAYLLDAYHADKLGGSGESFNWELAVEAKTLTQTPIILAGGLTPENVQDALDAVRPQVVDVASGVEASPGVKDHAKVRAFIRAVREWDLRNTA